MDEPVRHYVKCYEPIRKRTNTVWFFLDEGTRAIRFTDGRYNGGCQVLEEGGIRCYCLMNTELSLVWEGENFLEMNDGDGSHNNVNVLNTIKLYP